MAPSWEDDPHLLKTPTLLKLTTSVSGKGPVGTILHVEQSDRARSIQQLVTVLKDAAENSHDKRATSEDGPIPFCRSSLHHLSLYATDDDTVDLNEVGSVVVAQYAVMFHWDLECALQIDGTWDVMYGVLSIKDEDGIRTLDASGREAALMRVNWMTTAITKAAG